jgi:hypothetical protein
MFLQWCGDVWPKVYIFVQRFVSGTGRGFGSAPLKKHKRYAAFLNEETDKHTDCDFTRTHGSHCDSTGTFTY